MSIRNKKRGISPLTRYGRDDGTLKQWGTGISKKGGIAE
jgi:hypothetical protein